MKNEKKIVRGFTLIELLIVFAIMAIMTGVLFVNQNSRKATMAVEGAARIVAAQVRALQNEALSGKKIGDEYVGRFIFSVAADATIYTIEYRKSDNTPLSPPQSTTTDLQSKKVKFAAAESFYFATPNAKLSGAGSIRIVSADGTATRYVCVSVDGSVEEKTSCP